jgi:serine phosphatase RsbU (regulator of sigma subunit)
VDAPEGLEPCATAVALPLVVADRVQGVLTLTFRDERRLDADDTDFLRSLTDQAAAALDRARLYENRAYVARKLQEGLLPQRLADVPRMESAVVYESISGGGEVGGDFYDLFKSGPRRWSVAIGDVCGKGTEAAVITGLARHTLRAIARVQESPAEVLGFLNGALRRHGQSPAFCTVGYGMFEERDEGGYAIRLAAGGHPYPLLVRADGTVEEVEVAGTMLGVSEDPDLEERTLVLRPGDAIALYTDGVVDARRAGGERFGEERLLAAVRAAAGGSADDLAQAVEAAVRAHHTGAAADDRAILVLRALP